MYRPRLTSLATLQGCCLRTRELVDRSWGHSLIKQRGNMKIEFVLALSLSLVGLTPGSRNARTIVNSRSTFDDDSRSTSFSHYKNRGLENNVCASENPGILLFHILSHFHELIPAPRSFRRRLTVHSQCAIFGFGGGGGVWRFCFASCFSP